MEINIITKNITGEDRRVEMEYLEDTGEIKMLIYQFLEEKPSESVVIPFKSLSNFVAAAGRLRENDL